MLSGASPRRRAVLLGGVAVALAAGAVVVVASRPGPRPEGVPVFVVPGYGGDESSVSVVAAALRDAGRDVRVLVTPDTGRAAIAEGVAALDRAVRSSRAETVDVVGHSAGGVVARAWVAGGGRARHVVTLGSPHHGTELLSNLGAAVEQCIGACADLRPGSALLARLNAGDETPSAAQWVTFWTEDDQTVVPPRSGALEGARNVRVQDVCPRRVSHTGLTSDPVVVRWVVAAAAEGERAAFSC